MEVSHKVPRYLGGTDKDGRELLCKKCHEAYERKILIRAYKKVFNSEPFSLKRNLTPLQVRVRDAPEHLKQKIREEIRNGTLV